MIFSDECSVENVGKRQTWSWGYPHQKWQKDRVSEYPKGKQGSVMIWAAIGGHIKRSELVVMRRDKQSKHNGYSSLSYLDTLEKGLVEQYTGEIFMQDNAPIHTSHLVHNTLS